MSNLDEYVRCLAVPDGILVRENIAQRSEFDLNSFALQYACVALVSLLRSGSFTTRMSPLRAHWSCADFNSESDQTILPIL